MNAARIASLMAGIPVPQEERSPEAIRKAVRVVLDDPSYRQAAQVLARSIAELPPIQEAAGLVEQLASERRPIFSKANAVERPRA